MLSVGTSCTVRAINARPELNGRRGVVVAALDEAGRVGVQVEGEAKPLSLKPTNLDVVTCAETYVPEPPGCLYGLGAPASCVRYVPKARGSLPRWYSTRIPAPYVPRTVWCTTGHQR